jgi:4-hydroxybenzoate polyprenyltransferase
MKNIIISTLAVLRPKQWVKNIIIFAAFLFSMAEKTTAFHINPDSFLHVLWGFFTFCLVSSSIYIFNDIFDVDADRQHPKKKNRPIAAGKISIPFAWALFALLVIAGLGMAYTNDFAFGIICTVYFLLFLVYTNFLKKILILDIIIISTGFVLRAIGGAVLVKVGISAWLIICTIFLALFLGFGKRRSELVSLGDRASGHRMTLKRYSTAHLDLLLGICASLAIVCYTMYALSGNAMEQIGPDSLLTLPFVIFGIFRYLFMVINDHGGDDPASALFADFPLLLSVIIWVVLWVYLIAAKPGLLNGVILI